MKTTTMIKQTLAPSSFLRKAMKVGVSKLEVFDFKENWCNENPIIAELIREKALQYFMPPILDVGAGLGDIAFKAFPDKEAVCIDVNGVLKKEFPISRKHKRQKVDFFAYKPTKKINTVLISHTLQFIDDDVQLLQDKMDQLDPLYIVLVLNDNDGEMGEILQWFDERFENANPEVKIPDFPKGYSRIERFPFKANVKCPDFDKLAKQVGYLMVVELGEMLTEVKFFLNELLGGKPEFIINQSIEIYKRHDR